MLSSEHTEITDGGECELPPLPAFAGTGFAGISVAIGRRLNNYTLGNRSPTILVPFALSLSKGRSWFDRLTTNGFYTSIDRLRVNGYHPLNS